MDFIQKQTNAGRYVQGKPPAQDTQTFVFDRTKARRKHPLYSPRVLAVQKFPTVIVAELCSVCCPFVLLRVAGTLLCRVPLLTNYCRARPLPHAPVRFRTKQPQTSRELQRPSPRPLLPSVLFQTKQGTATSFAFSHAAEGPVPDEAAATAPESPRVQAKLQTSTVQFF